jgi:predicted  nucleic acid-binding Zn-ribbon protein
MINEKYLKMAISIRRTYLKLINNLDLYHSRVLKVSSNLEETLSELNSIQSNLESDKKPDSKETLDKLLEILQDVEDEGKKLETLINPINKEIEKLGKEEKELYRQIVEHHPEMSEDQIVNSVRDRLLKEGLS